MNLNVSRKTILGLSTLLILMGCEQSQQPSEEVKSAASGFTIASNRQFADELDLDHQQDFEDARRGMVAAAPNESVTAASGVQVWDGAAYDFIQGDAPDTVNPSLWRQAKLNNIRGLFKVEEGIYQLRGFDLANTTLKAKMAGYWLIL